MPGPARLVPGSPCPDPGIPRSRVGPLGIPRGVTLTLALSHRGRGDVAIGVLCFSLGSRPRIGVRGRPLGNDG